MICPNCDCQKKWKPNIDERYWFITNYGEFDNDVWSNLRTDLLRRSFLGIFPTKELAEARLKEVKEKLGIE